MHLHEEECVFSRTTVADSQSCKQALQTFSLQHDVRSPRSRIVKLVRLPERFAQRRVLLVETAAVTSVVHTRPQGAELMSGQHFSQ
jgi:hypothetical protein